VSESTSRILIAALAGLALAAAVVGFQLLHHGSTRLTPPAVLGSFVRLDDQGVKSRLDELRHTLGSTGIHDAAVALYGPPGTSVTETQTGFVLIAGKASGGLDLQSEVRNSAVSLGPFSFNGGHFETADETVAGVTYTCSTFTAPQGQATSCIWQGSSSILFGMGANVTAADTANLTSLAKAGMNING